MPYFIYKVSGDGRFSPLESFDRFLDAKKQVRGLREGLRAEDEHGFRIIFAGDTEEAGRLLREKREPHPGEEG